MAIGTNRYFRRRYLPVWLTLLVGMVVSGGLGWGLYREAVELDRKRMALRIKATMDQFDGRIEKTEALLFQLQDYLMLSGETRPRVFSDWCSKHGLYFNFPWVHGIVVATNRHPAPWRQHLPHPPSTWTPADWDTLRKLALQNPIECSIALKSSVAARKQFLEDYDLKGLMQQTHRLTLAIKGQGLRMSGRRTVMLDANSNALTGTLLFLPVYQAEVADLMAQLRWTLSERIAASRWLHLDSMIVAPIDFKALEKSVWGGLAPDLGVELFSSTNQTAGTWLNASEGGPRAADPRFRAYLMHRLPWPMYGGRFSIFFYTTPLFEAQSPRRLAKTVTAAGVAMTLLASALLGVSLRARDHQEQMTDQIREARDALVAAQKEREKLNHDLHDNSIQALYAIQLGLSHTAQKLAAEPIGAGRELFAARAELDAVIAELRRFVTAEESANTNVDLSGVLRALAQRAYVGTSAKVELHCDSDASERLSGVQAVQLANIAREALSNSLRHAKPRHVRIALRSEPKAVCMELSDDGSGFNPESAARRGVGLASMSTRVKEMHGTLNIQSTPGQGTRVAVRVPAAPLERDQEPGETDELDEA